MKDAPPRPEGRDLAIVDATVAGHPARAIAADLGISESTVVRARRRWRPVIRADRAARWDAYAEQASQAVPRALDAVVRLLDDNNGSTVLGAARTILVAAPAIVAAAENMTRQDSAEVEAWGVIDAEATHMPYPTTLDALLGDDDA